MTGGLKKRWSNDRKFETKFFTYQNLPGESSGAQTGATERLSPFATSWSTSEKFVGRLTSHYLGVAAQLTSSEEEQDGSHQVHSTRDTHDRPFSASECAIPPSPETMLKHLASTSIT
ncbi:hypothetical protein AHF37_08399 [Paragonimus kellicotti]|nr:hypothetical protein AHF37_08399 [Paragonimus kellicotti]